ncbi:MAG TPA: efflux transporter outer membrane subunit [Rhizomicrobium sp.]|jgi:NodT family efflux transporter outer membrane factor (OMF) lipoprotein|nr:efflux transporter outer membrane subunit [Rhizomicrobium sp.]
MRSPGIITAALLLSGCAVGPDFKKPAPPTVGAYTPAPLSSTEATPGITGGEAQRFANGGDIAGDWWTLYHSPALNSLIAQALKNNSDLKAAEAALKAAHETALAGRGPFFPQVGLSAGAFHYQQPGTLAPVPSNNAFQYDLFTPQLNISYMPDVFGLQRRTVESLDAQAEAARYQMIATYNTLVDNVVSTAVQEASIRNQIEATNEMVSAMNKSLAILKYQLDKGYASGVDYNAQKTAAAAAAAALPPLIKQDAQLNDELAVLVGRYPSDQPPEKLDLSTLELPEDLPVSLPSKLVEQRPDVLQAQANLHSASAQIGVAIANMLPNLTLTAQAGSSALVFNQLFTDGTDFWNAGAGLAATLFDGGTLYHTEKAARANYQQSAAQYRSTVLTAFQNVADSLTALQQDARALKASADADAAAKATLDITQYQLKDGYNDTLGLLLAEQAYQQAHIALLQAEASRFADTAALFQALGGGWWHRPELGEANAK